MTIVAAVARVLGQRRPARGRALLLFQPAEETGAGAAAILADERFAALAPDYAFALHNIAGLPLGHAAVSPGPANCASRGLRIVLTGRIAHASMPETGVCRWLRSPRFSRHSRRSVAAARSTPTTHWRRSRTSRWASRRSASRRVAPRSGSRCARCTTIA